MKNFKLVALSILVGAMLTACGPSFDPAAVKVGMTEAEVTSAVGKAPMTMTILGKTTWTYGKHQVKFEDGKVTSCEEK